LLVESVDSGIVSLAEYVPHARCSFMIRPAIALPPGLRPDVVPLRGAWTKMHDADERGDVRAITSPSDPS
jgi:hypothetical protein